MDYKQVAETIRQQIKALDPYALWAYGASNMVAITSKGEDELFSHGGLSFKVKGLKHKGHIIVKLMGNDTYTIQAWKIFMSGKKAGVADLKKEFTDVYCDQLVDVLDLVVEGKGA